VSATIWLTRKREPAAIENKTKRIMSNLNFIGLKMSFVRIPVCNQDVIPTKDED
jgi:hypothetical protein